MWWCLEKLRDAFRLFKLLHVIEKLDITLEMERRIPMDRSRTLQLVREAIRYLQEETNLDEKRPGYPAQCCFQLLHFCFSMSINDGPLIRDIMRFFIKFAENKDIMFCFIDGVSFPYGMGDETIDAKVTYLIEMSEKGQFVYKGQRMSDFMLFQYVLTCYDKLSNQRLRLFLRHGTRELLTPCVPNAELTNGHDFESSYTLIELLRFLLWNINLVESSKYRSYDSECIRIILRALWYVPKHISRGITLPQEFADIDEVPSLKHLSRCSIRRQLYLNWRLPCGIVKLPLSPYLIAYLKLKFD